MSRPLRYSFLNRQKAKIDHCFGLRWSSRPTDDASVAMEPVKALARYIGLCGREGVARTVLIKRVRRFSFVQVDDAEAISMKEVLNRARQGDKKLEPHIRTIAEIYPEVLLKTSHRVFVDAGLSGLMLLDDYLSARTELDASERDAFWIEKRPSVVTELASRKRLCL